MMNQLYKQTNNCEEVLLRNSLKKYFRKNPQDLEKLSYLKLEVITQAYNRMRRM